MKNAIAATALCLCAVRAPAQVIGTNLELFGGVGIVGGMAHVSFNNTDRTLLHAGPAGEVGIQGEKVGAGVGVRAWRFQPTSDLGGDGADASLFLDFRANSSARTNFRLGVGFSSDKFNGGKASTSELFSDAPTLWIAGVRHELPILNGPLLLLSGDVILPDGAGAIHRSLPVIELGASIRFRAVKEIRTLP